MEDGRWKVRGNERWCNKHVMYVRITQAKSCSGVALLQCGANKTHKHKSTHAEADCWRVQSWV